MKIIKLVNLFDILDLLVEFKMDSRSSREWRTESKNEWTSNIELPTFNIEWKAIREEGKSGQTATFANAMEGKVPGLPLHNAHGQE